MSSVAKKIIQAAAGASRGYSGPLGLTSSLDSISGELSGWRTRSNIDISEYLGATVRPVFHYYSGSSFRGDIQIDNIQIGGYTYSFESSLQSFQCDNSSNSANYTSVSWVSLATGTLLGRWNRDSGGTPSSNTGMTSAANGTYYVYAETSGSGSPGKNFWLRGPEIVLPSDIPVMSYAEARLGVNMGTLNVYLDITARA